MSLNLENSASPQLTDSEKPEQVYEKKEKTPLTSRTWAKATAFILAVITLALTVLCAAGAVVMIQQGVYTTDKEENLQQIYDNIGYETMEGLICNLEADMDYPGESNLTDYCTDTNICKAQIINADTGEVVWAYTSSAAASESDYSSITDRQRLEAVSGNENLSGAVHLSTDGYFSLNDKNYKADIWIYATPEFNDEYTLAYYSMSLLYALKYRVYVIGGVSLVLFAACFVFLMCASGHRKGYDEIRPGWGTKVPFDLLTAVVVACAILLCALFDFMFSGTGTAALIVGALLFIIAAEVILLGYFMSFSLRVKLGKWWKNTVIYRLLSLIPKGAGLLLRFLKQLPLVTKSVFIVLGVSIMELFLLMLCWNSYGAMTALWLINALVLGGGALYCAICFKKLQKAGEALAEGDLTYQVDAKNLCGDFKAHGEALNSIAKGMTIAVESQMKSERMKTELITNVSHDIKTPLTSIINYTDLISKEDCDNKKIREYSQVLLRQSQRLKRLIEDLVEASKASTGNLEVNLIPCEANILLTQAAGEYEEKLKANNLQLVTSQPDKPVIIMADGRRLWRVFDNLINNICKYSQNGTRVYLSLEEQNGQAAITFKNISGAALNISPDELMERFVRGDKSRNTEGNGLGLSIAKSLTELQKGALELSIDGDLFKVTLKFPIAKT